jgi:hypothetical protein
MMSRRPAILRDSCKGARGTAAAGWRRGLDRSTTNIADDVIASSRLLVRRHSWQCQMRSFSRSRERTSWQRKRISWSNYREITLNHSVCERRKICVVEKSVMASTGSSSIERSQKVSFFCAGVSQCVFNWQSSGVHARHVEGLLALTNRSNSLIAIPLQDFVKIRESE